MHNEYVSLLTVSQFKAFRKAVNVLVRAGIERTRAIEILVSAQMESRRFNDRMSA